MQLMERQVVVDSQDERVAVLLGLARYEALLDAAEELDAIRAYDETKAYPQETVSLAEAIADIEVRPQ